MTKPGHNDDRDCEMWQDWEELLADLAFVFGCLYSVEVAAAAESGEGSLPVNKTKKRLRGWAEGGPPAKRMHLSWVPP
jgi:hypothetical protein